MVEVADLVDFVLDLQQIPEKRHQWIARINHLDSHGLMPRMTIKVAADQIEIVRPSVECVGSRMNTEETAARAHKVEKSCLLRVAHRKFSGCVEHHRGVALEVFGRKFRRVFRCSDFKDTRIAFKLGQDCLGKRYNVMPVAGRVCEIEDALWRAIRMRAEWSDCRRAAEERDELSSPHNPSAKPNQPCVERSLAQIRPALALRHCALAQQLSLVLPRAVARVTGTSAQGCHV